MALEFGHVQLTAWQVLTDNFVSRWLEPLHGALESSDHAVRCLLSPFFIAEYLEILTERTEGPILTNLPTPIKAQAGEQCSITLQRPPWLPPHHRMKHTTEVYLGAVEGGQEQWPPFARGTI